MHLARESSGRRTDTGKVHHGGFPKTKKRTNRPSFVNPGPHIIFPKKSTLIEHLVVIFDGLSCLILCDIGVHELSRVALEHQKPVTFLGAHLVVPVLTRVGSLLDGRYQRIKLREARNLKGPSAAVIVNFLCNALFNLLFPKLVKTNGPT